jgi:hypothetical protein
MNKLFDVLNTFLLHNLDKLFHYTLGGPLALFGIIVGLVFGNPVAWMIGIPTVVMLGKEVWDRFNPTHQCDVWDFVAGILGCVSVWSAYLLGSIR